MSYLFRMRATTEVLRAGTIVATSMATLVGAFGCNHMERRYLAPEGATVFAMAFAPDTAPFFMGDEESLYLIETPIEVPIRPPTAAEQAALAGAPWVRRGDYEIEVTFTVTNLDTESARFVGVTLNGINPMFEYVPGFTVDEPLATLGTSLKLPEQYESQRAEIEARLPKID
jgi:hypothetical protein